VSRNRYRVVATCAVAAVLAVAGVFPAGAKPKPRKGSFIALTYNVAGLPQGISGSDPQTNSPQIGPKLNDFDLVLLQEDWADPAPGVDIFFHEQVTAEASHPYRSTPASHPYGTDVSRFPSGPTMIADGLNRLSDFEFGTLERHMWEVCFGEFHFAAVNAVLDATGLDGAVEDAGFDDELDDGAADCGAQKGFSVARTRLANGVEIDVYNLHADAGSDPRDQEARAAGFRQLAAFIGTHSDGHGVILGGDTNLHTEPDSDRARDIEAWRTFQEATGLVDVCRVLDCAADDGAIDKFAFRSSKRVKLAPLSATVERERFTRADGEPLSDHDPLSVVFRWKVASGRR